MKKIAILGSTGSIGTQTLEVVNEHREEFSVVALSGGNNIELLLKQIKEHQPKLVSVKTKELADQLRNYVDNKVTVVHGEEGLIQVATHEDANLVITAVVGSVGLKPTIKAIEQGKAIGLANKETLVSAGHIVMKMAQEKGVPIIPIDSEHSAIFQSMNGEKKDQVRKIILTASGGSFRNKTREELINVSIEDALKHPNWSMGAKITIDSATMMNKGLEVIEAHWLFDMPFEKIDVVIHPESIIHSMVEYNDKAILAELGTPDMKVPIQYAMTYPNRIELNTQPLDLVSIGRLNFYKPDFERFPSLRLAFESGKQGGTMPTVLNAANEIVVDAFLQGRVPFIEIEAMVASVLDKHDKVSNPSLDEIFHVDKWARSATDKLIKNKGW